MWGGGLKAFWNEEPAIFEVDVVQGRFVDFLAFKNLEFFVFF